MAAQLDLTEFSQPASDDSSPTGAGVACAHCGAPVPSPRLNMSVQLQFCCTGCETVHSIIHARGLQEFYDLRAQEGTIRPLVVPQNTQHEYLDAEDVRRLYVSRGTGGLGDASEFEHLRIYLEGIHCLSCLWIVERLQQLTESVLESRLDMGQSVLYLRIKRDTRISAIMDLLSFLGYQPRLLKIDESERQARTRRDRRELTRIAVVGACAGNIMLMIIPIYSGLTGTLAVLFNWISFFLFLPVVTYGALPLYRSVLGSLRARTISIDLPIVLALVGGFASSVLDLVHVLPGGPSVGAGYGGGGDHVYFDSLSMALFLLLSSRYYLDKLKANQLTEARMHIFLLPSMAEKWDLATRAFKYIPSADLAIDDILRVKPRERIPADGVVIKGSTHIDQSVLTGEVRPVRASVTSPVSAGTLNLENEIEVQVKASGRETQVGKLLDQVERESFSKSKLLNFAGRVGAVFTGITALVGVVLFSTLSVDVAVTRLLAVAIAACPCVFAFAIPLVLSRSLKWCSERGIWLKGEYVLERATYLKNIVFDKTGTLTQGELKVSQWENLARENNSLAHLPTQNIIYTMEQFSRHPIAQAIVQHLSARGAQLDPFVENVVEVAGQGVEAIRHGSTFKIVGLNSDQSAEAPETSVVLNANGTAAVKITLTDDVRAEALDVLRKLDGRYLLHLISGDGPSPVNFIAKKLGISLARTRSRVSPQNKSDYIKAHKNSMMIGDGVNDALALSSAQLGVATSGSLEVSLRAADVYLSDVSLTRVLDLLIASKHSMKLIRRNLITTSTYNLVSLALASTGHLSPLIAAIIMPLSAVSVAILSISQPKGSSL